tara:strand:+ start:53 stop:724 length:672 start_codon:yes stop_codon:yes gene_type:complete
MWDMRMHNKFGNSYFSDRPCPDCGSLLDDHNTNYNAGTGPLGADGVKTKIVIKYCDDNYHQRARERMSKKRVYTETKIHLLDTAPGQEVLEFLFPETKESVITQRTVNHKTRNQALATKLKELYNYTCQVEDCNETEVEIAHIYKHSLPDSVDDETNAWCLCCNHHRAYDANRMIFNPALDGRFIRYDRFKKIYEIGRIIYDEKHTIDIKWIKKSRDFHDSKK